ncbi:MAG: glycosyl hydrolase 53 family protein [Bacilli bacterium]|nr:glycosyl hydrolase 53 family protein [Bacilli bacterium]
MNKRFLWVASLSLMALTSCGSTTPASSPAAPSSQGGASSVTPSASGTPTSTPDVPIISPDSSSSTPALPDNTEEHDYASLKVNQPSKTLVDDFAFGADLSIVAEIEKNGGVYYNEEGKAEDVFQILARDGVNYCRLRLWNNPYSTTEKDADGNPAPYGGGTNDLVTDIKLAKRAKAAGMKVLLDFHYSDSWADPQKFFVPKDWADDLAIELADDVSEWTEYALNAFKVNGVTVDSVQIGNESNNGLAGSTDRDTMAGMIDAGAKAAKKVFPEITTLVHLTNIKSPASVWKFLDSMKNNDVEYDMVGLSYYPYWHGSKDNLLSIMNRISSVYGKPSMVVETSYGFTDDPNENCGNTYHSSTFETPGGYLTSIQGQATMVADLVNTISLAADSKGNSVGKGVFWWEPAWLPVKGSTWASPAGQFYNKFGYDGKLIRVEADGTHVYEHPQYPGKENYYLKYSPKSCLPAWCNQGWFSYTGKALPSASIYKHIVAGDRTLVEETAGPRETKLDLTVNLKNLVEIGGKKMIPLPETAQVVSNLEALRSRPVTWNQDERDAVLAGGDGKYVVHGSVEGKFEIEAKVNAETNYVLDYSFENQGGDKEEEYDIKEPWVVESSIGRAVAVYAKNEGNLDGQKYFHWYNTSKYNFSIRQTLTDLRPGIYDFSTRVMAGDSAAAYNSFKLFYQFEGQNAVYVDVMEDAVKGWGSPLAKYMQRAAIDGIEVPEGVTKVTIGMQVECNEGAWGHSDLWSFALHKEPEAVEEYVADGALEDGDFAAQTLWTEPDEPWYVDANSFGKFQIANDESMRKTAAYYVGWWDEAAKSFAFHQNIKNLAKGQYVLRFTALIDPSLTDSFNVYYLNEAGEKVNFDAKALLPVYSDNITSSADIDVPVVIGDSGKTTIGFEYAGLAGSWGRMTDFHLYAKGSEPAPYVPPVVDPDAEEYVADGALEDGDFALQTAGGKPASPWYYTEEGAHLEVGNNAEMRKVAANYVSWWNSTGDSFAPLAFTMHQNIKNLEAGTYTFKFTIISGDQWQFDHFSVTYQNGEKAAVAVDVKTQLKGWVTDAATSTVDISVDVVVEEGVTFVLGFDVASVQDDWANAWGRMTDFSLTKKAA